MRSGSAFYRDNPNLACMGHPECRQPCRYEPDQDILRDTRRALTAGTITDVEMRCIELDILGYPGRTIIGYAGQDPTGALSKRAKYTCERAYSKIGRRLCELCQMLWSYDRPKGPRLDADLQLKYQKEEWKSVRSNQSTGTVRIKRRKVLFSISDRDSFSAVESINSEI